ncbi:hypothetical protein PAT3040_01338 [Paenibacillus agaridevorans]|uniref:Uncharacterized protein n=1 Tax=Paenibacillus agaridevorans TaxID=171404 RepID=A0A2R5EJI9_9BACL|nr:hypothetical protein PAT3040_01338 [Paenibacillus agaridevorans]
MGSMYVRYVIIRNYYYLNYHNLFCLSTERKKAERYLRPAPSSLTFHSNRIPLRNQ